MVLLESMDGLVHDAPEPNWQVRRVIRLRAPLRDFVDEHGRD
jgi:hypothetical protein